MWLKIPFLVSEYRLTFCGSNILIKWEKKQPVWNDFLVPKRALTFIDLCEDVGSAHSLVWLFSIGKHLVDDNAETPNVWSGIKLLFRKGLRCCPFDWITDSLRHHVFFHYWADKYIFCCHHSKNGKENVLHFLTSLLAVFRYIYTYKSFNAKLSWKTSNWKTKK